MRKNALSVIVGADDPLVLRGLQSFLTDEIGVDVLAGCADERQLLLAMTSNHADIVLVDFDRPEARLSEFLGQVRVFDRSVRIIVLLRSPTPKQMVAGARSGASICGMSSDLSELKAMLKSETPTGPSSRPAHAAGDGYADVKSLLTSREIEVVRAVACGMISRAVASQLRISEGTVKVHLSRIYQKVGVHNRTELAHQLRHLLPDATSER